MLWPTISPEALSLVQKRWPFLRFLDDCEPSSNWSIRTLHTYIKQNDSDFVDNAASDDKTQNHDPYVCKCCERTYVMNRNT